MAVTTNDAIAAAVTTGTDFWSPGRIVSAQIAALREVEEFRSRLSAPSQNNFVLRMVPKSRDEDAQFEAQSRTTTALNKADYHLLQHCRRLVPCLDADPVTSNAMRDLVDSWQTNYDEQRNLLGCENAIELASVMAPHLDLSDAIAAQAPQLARAFIDVPTELFEVVRLNFYLPWAAVLPMARTLVATLDQLELLHSVERFEIAQRQRIDDAHVAPRFPTLILYLGLTATDRPDTVAMKAIHELARGLITSLNVPPPHDGIVGDFGLVTAPGLAVTQGFRLHKRYLRFLGVLDEVFDPAVGHALVARHRTSGGDFNQQVRAAFAAPHDPDLPPNPNNPRKGMTNG